MTTTHAIAAHTPANWIAGRPGPCHGALDNTDPATGRVIGTAPDSSAAEVDGAVAAARAAQPAWAATPAEDRARALHALADAVEGELDAFAHAESVDTGKPVAVARAVDIPRAVRNLRFFAAAADQAASECHDAPGRMLSYTLRRPRGVAGCISPWNLPLYLLTWKLAPALACGCAVVAKPSELTPTTASMLAARSAGVLPDGVLNIVHGRGRPAGAALVEHPGVPTITFTGSTAVGRWIASTCGGMLKRCSLELGGKNPFIVFDDAHPERAADLAASAAFSNQGQICLCGSRVLVQRGVYDELTQRLADHAHALAPGDPLDPATRFGALISHDHRDRVAAFVRDALAAGARALAGGAPTDAADLPERVRGGAFYPPTVLVDAPEGCAILREEVFGPVCTVQSFDDEAHALRLANDTDYGLAASVLTADVGRATRVAEAINAGVVWVNGWMLRDLRTPFGGMGQSGVGREGGLEAMRFFTEPRAVTIATGEGS